MKYLRLRHTPAVVVIILASGDSASGAVHDMGPPMMLMRKVNDIATSTSR